MTAPDGPARPRPKTPTIGTPGPQLRAPARAQRRLRPDASYGAATAIDARHA